MSGVQRAPLTVRIHDSGRGCAARGVHVIFARRTEPPEPDAEWEPLEEG